VLERFAEDERLKDPLVYYVDRTTGVFVSSTDQDIMLSTDHSFPSNILWGPESVIPVSEPTDPERTALHINLMNETTHLLIDEYGDWASVPEIAPAAVEINGTVYVWSTTKFDYYGLQFTGVILVEQAVFLVNYEEVREGYVAQQLVLIIVPLGVIFVLVIVGMAFYVRKLLLQQDKYRKGLLDRVVNGVLQNRTCRFSCCVMRGDHFVAAGSLLSHEQAMDKGVLKFCHTFDAAKEMLTADNVVSIFFSHQWLGWSHPDPKNEHYDMMAASTVELARQTGMPLDKVWIWADYFSVPQANDCLKLLAVETLHVYTALAKYFVIVAPPCTHNNTNDQVDFESYLRRGWCRLEGFSRVMQVGDATNMIVSTEPSKLEPLDADTIGMATRVFDGEFTCCRLGHPKGMMCDKHRVVEPMLGLYCEQFLREEAEAEGSEDGEAAAVESGGFDLGSYVHENKGAIFPRHFFGSLLDVADKHIRDGSLIGFYVENRRKGKKGVVGQEALQEKTSSPDLTASMRKKQFAKQFTFSKPLSSGSSCRKCRNTTSTASSTASSAASTTQTAQRTEAV